LQMAPPSDVWWDVMVPLLNLSRNGIGATYLGALSGVINAKIDDIMSHDEEYNLFYNSFMFLALEHLSSNLEKASVADYSEVKTACRNGMKYLFLKERVVDSVELKYMIAILKSCLTGESGLQRIDIYYLVASIKKAKVPSYFSPPNGLGVAEAATTVETRSLIHRLLFSYRTDRTYTDAEFCLHVKTADEMISHFAYKSFLKSFTSDNILLAEELHCAEMLLKYFMSFNIIRKVHAACQEAVKCSEANLIHRQDCDQIIDWQVAYCQEIFLDCTSMIEVAADLPIWGSVNGDDHDNSNFSKLLEMSNICLLSVGCMNIAIAINCEGEFFIDPDRIEKAIVVANEGYEKLFLIHEKFMRKVKQCDWYSSERKKASFTVLHTILNFASNRILLIVKIVSEMLRYSKGIMQLCSWPLLLDIFCETMTSFNFSKAEFTADGGDGTGESVHLFSLVLQMIRTFLSSIFAANEDKLQANREIETVVSAENVTKEENRNIVEDTDPVIGRWLSAVFAKVPAMIDDELEQCRLKFTSQRCTVEDLITAFGKVTQLLEITPKKQFIAGRYLFVPTERDAETLAAIISDLSSFKNNMSEFSKVEAAIMPVVQNFFSENLIDHSFILVFMNRLGINFESSDHIIWPLDLDSIKVRLLAYVVLCRFRSIDPFTNERIAFPIWNKVMKALELNYNSACQVDEPSLRENKICMNIEHMRFLFLLYYNEPVESRRELTFLALRSLEKLLLCDKRCATALPFLSRLLQIVDCILHFEENPPFGYFKMVYESLFMVPDKSEDSQLRTDSPAPVQVVQCVKKLETTLEDVYGLEQTQLNRKGRGFFYSLYNDRQYGEYRLNRVTFIDVQLTRNLQLALARTLSNFLSCWISANGDAAFAAYCCYYIRRILLYLPPSPEIMKISNVDRPLDEQQSSYLLLLASRCYYSTSYFFIDVQINEHSDEIDKQLAEYLKRMNSIRAIFDCFMLCFVRRKNTVDEIEFEDWYLRENYQYGSCAVIFDLMLIELRCLLRSVPSHNSELPSEFHSDIAEMMNTVCLLIRHFVEIIRYLICCVDSPLQLREGSFSHWHKHCKQLLNIVGDYGLDVRPVYKEIVGTFSVSLQKALSVFKWDECSLGSFNDQFSHHKYEETSYFYQVAPTTYISDVFDQHLENIARASIWDLLNSWKHVLFTASAVLHDYLNIFSPKLSVIMKITENLRRYSVFDTVLAFWPTKNACNEENFPLVEVNRESNFYDKFFNFLHHSVTSWVNPCSISEFIFASLLSYLEDEEVGEKFFQNRSVVELIMPLINLKSSAIIKPIYVIKYLSVLLKIAMNSSKREFLLEGMSSSNAVLKTKAIISALLDNGTILSDAMKVVFQNASNFEMEDQIKQLLHCKNAAVVGLEFVNNLTLCLMVLKKGEVEVGEYAGHFVRLFLSIDGIDEFFYSHNYSTEALEEPLNSVAVKWYWYLLGLAKLNPDSAVSVMFDHFCACVEKFLEMGSLMSVLENKCWKRDQMELMDLMLFLTTYFTLLIGPADALLIKKDTSANGQLCSTFADNSDLVMDVEETDYEDGAVVAIDCFAVTRSGCCSFIVTGRHMCNQKTYYCYDCSVNGKFATVCSACAVKCHNDHDVIYIGDENMFCQCIDALKEHCVASLNWRQFSKYLNEMNATNNVHTISDANNIYESQDESKCSRILFDSYYAFCFGELTKEKELLLNDKSAHFAVIQKCMLKLFNLLQKVIVVTKEVITPIGHMERLSESLSQFLHGKIQAFEKTRLITMQSAELPAWRKQLIPDDDHVSLCRNYTESISERRYRCFKFCILNGHKSLFVVCAYKKRITISPVNFLVSRAALKYKLGDLKIDVKKGQEMLLAFKPTFMQAINGNGAIFLIGGIHNVFIVSLNYGGRLNSKKMLKLNIDKKETVRRAFWMPNSTTEVVVVTTQRVCVYYLWYSYELPVYCYQLHSGAVADATVAYYEEKSLTRFIIIMSNNGLLYTEKIGQSHVIPKKDRLKYLQDPLKFTHPALQDIAVEKLKNCGLSVHYSHCLSTLFFSYSNGESYYCSFSMGSLQNIRTVDFTATGRQFVSIKSWEDVEDLPGFICAEPEEFGPILLKVDGPRILIDPQCCFLSPRISDLKSCRIWQHHMQPCTVIATLSESCSITLWNVDDNYRNYWDEIPLTNNPLYNAQFNELEEFAPKILSRRKSLYPPLVDIFERSLLLSDLEISSENLLDTSSSDSMIEKQPLYFFNKGDAAVLHIFNTDESMAISGVKVYIDCSQKEKVPSFLAVDGQFKYVSRDVSRWYDFPLSYEESINCSSKIKLSVGKSSGEIIVVYCVQLYVRRKTLQVSALCHNMMTDSRQFSTFGSAMLEVFNADDPGHCKQYTVARVGLHKAELLMGAVCSFLRIYHMEDDLQERKKFFIEDLDLNIDKFHQLLTFSSTSFLKNQAKYFIDHFMPVSMEEYNFTKASQFINFYSDMSRVQIYNEMLQKMEMFSPDPNVLEMILNCLRKMAERRPVNFLRLVFRRNGDSEIFDRLMVLFWETVDKRKHFADAAPIGSVLFNNMKSFVGCIVDILFSSVHLASVAQLKKFCAILGDLLLESSTVSAESRLPYMCSEAVQRNVLQAFAHSYHKQFQCEKRVQSEGVADSQDGQRHTAASFTEYVMNLKKDEIVNYDFFTLSEYLLEMKRDASKHDSRNVVSPEESDEGGSSMNFQLTVDPSNFTSPGVHSKLHFYYAFILRVNNRFVLLCLADNGLLFASDNYQLNILLMLRYLTPHFVECSAIKSIPFLQTLLALSSAVDVSNLKYAKPFLSLVRRWISCIDLKDSFCEHTPSAEANLMKLRFINILLNRMSDGISCTIFLFLMDVDILSFCYVVLDKMHPKLAGSSVVNSDDLDDETDAVVHCYFPDELWPFFLHDYVEKNDANLFSLFDQLAVEIALRLPYQLKRFGLAPKVREALFLSCWINVLMKYISCTKTLNLYTQFRKLFIYICGSVDLCRWYIDRSALQHLLNDVLRHSRHIFSVSTCVSPSRLNSVYHTKMCLIMWRLKLCLRIGTRRPLNLQKFFISNCEILQELLFVVAVKIHRNITKCVLSLISIAFGAGIDDNNASCSFAFSPEMARHLAIDIFKKNDFLTLEQLLFTLVMQTREGPQNAESLQFFRNLMKFVPNPVARNFVVYVWKRVLHRFPEYGCRSLHMIFLLTDTIGFLTDVEMRRFMTNIADYFTENRRAILTDPIFAVYSKVGKQIPVDGFAFDKRPCFACHRRQSLPFEAELLTLVRYAQYSSTSVFMELRSTYEIERIVLKIVQKRQNKLLKKMELYYSGSDGLSFYHTAILSKWCVAMKCELAENQQTVVMDFAIPITARYLLINYCDFYDTKTTPSTLQAFFNCEACMNLYPKLCFRCKNVAVICENCEEEECINGRAFLCQSCGVSPYTTLKYSVRARESPALPPVMSLSDVQKVSQEGNLLLAKFDNAVKAMETDLKDVQRLAEVGVLSAEHDICEEIEEIQQSSGNSGAIQNNIMKASRYEEYLNLYHSRCKSNHRAIILNYETQILIRMSVSEFENGRLDENPFTSQYLKCRQSCYCCTLWSCAAALILIDNLLRRVNFDASSSTLDGFIDKILTFVLNSPPLRSDPICRSILYNLSQMYNIIAFTISERLAESLFYSLVRGKIEFVGDYLDIVYHCARAEGNDSDVWSSTVADIFKAAICSQPTSTAQSMLGVCLKFFTSGKFLLFNLDGGTAFRNSRALHNDLDEGLKLQFDLRKIFRTTLQKPPYPMESVYIQSFIASMVKLLTHPYSLYIRKMTVTYLHALISQPGTLRVQIFENLLNRIIPFFPKCDDRIGEFFGFLLELLNDPNWRSFFLQKGFFPIFLQVTLREIERLQKIDRSPLSQVDLDCGCLLLNVLKVFQKLHSYDELKDHLDHTAAKTVLYGHTVLRSMVIKRSVSAKHAQGYFEMLIDCMKSGNATLVRSFAKAAFQLLYDESVKKNWQHVLHICDSIRSAICPERRQGEKPFQIVIFGDYSFGDLRGNWANRSFLSTDSDMGPRMRDIKNKICRDCEMIPFTDDDNTLELVVEHKVIALYLNVADVYKYLWVPEKGETEMVITYRVPGLNPLDADEYVWELPTTEENSSCNVALIHEIGGEAVLVNCLNNVDVLEKHGVCSEIVDLLRIATAVKENRLALLSPHLKTISVIMKKVLLIMMDDVRMQGLNSDTMLRIVCRLYEDANLFSASEFERFFEHSLTDVVISLMDVVRNRKIGIDERSEELILRTTALLTMGNEERIDAVANYFDEFTNFFRYDAGSTLNEQKMGRMLCFFVNGLPESANGFRVRVAFFNKGFVLRAINYFLYNYPCAYPLSAASSEVMAFMEKPGLGYALKFLVGICRSCEPTQMLVANSGCLPIVHCFELIPDNRNICILSHQLMNILSQNQAASVKVDAVREHARMVKKSIAAVSRKVELEKLGMKMSEDGTVRIASSVYLDVDLPDEGHFACVICQEGFHNVPLQELGIYVFMKNVSVRDVLLDSVDGFIPELAGQSTVTQFNLVHYQCHSRSIELASSYRDEWNSATLHNADTLCNAILPYPGPQIALDRQVWMMKCYEKQFKEVFPGVSLSCSSVINDLTFLLIRFCWKKSFSTDSQGGGPESNMHLIPYMLYLGGFVSTGMSDDEENRLRSNLNQFLATESSRWFSNAFDVRLFWISVINDRRRRRRLVGLIHIFLHLLQANGLFFQSTLFILYHDQQAWAERRLDILKRFICAGHCHALFHRDSQKQEPIEFNNYIPYLIYFALINSIYTHIFKSVSVTPETETWLKALMLYISTNYIELYNSTTQLFTTYEDDLSQFASFFEFCDICGLLECIPDPDTFFSNCVSYVPSLVPFVRVFSTPSSRAPALAQGNGHRFSPVQNVECCFMHVLPVKNYFCTKIELETAVQAQGTAMKNKQSVPTVEEMAQEKLTQIAASYWASFGNAHRPFSAKVVADIYKNELLEKNFAARSIVLLEFSQYLERFLWPNFDGNTATVEHVMSILVMANEKIRECVPLWPIFFTREKEEFEKFFARILEISLDDELLTIAEQLHVIIFLNHCFTSVEIVSVRSVVQKIISLPMWICLPETVREQCLNGSMKLKKYWKYNQKQFGKLDEESKRKTLFYWRYISDLIKKFLKILHSIPPEDEQCDLNSIRYCERFLEMLIDMESLLPIRRFLNVVLLESRILCYGALSTLVKRHDGGLFTELLNTLKRCAYFEIDDLTGESLSQKEMTIIHVERITKLQKYNDKMKAFCLSPVSEVDNRNNLFKYLSVLSDEELLNLSADLNLVDPNHTEDPTLNRALLMEIMVNHHEKQPSQLDRINEMSLYPSEEILWNEKVVPVGYFKHATCLALPKLGLQFLTLYDYLLRNFTLFRLESTYEIRLDIEDAIFRLKPWKHEMEANTLVCGSWARMAMPIMHFAVIEVGRPKVGEKAPSVVRADLQLMLNVRQDVRTEWENLRKHDVGFLLTVRPTAPPGTQYCPSEPFLPQIPVVYVRGCEIEGMLGVDGNLIEEYAPPEAKLGFNNDVRTFRVLLDCQQYRLDMMQQEKGGEDVYQTFNVFVRRKPKENNFKAVLDTIRQLMNSECVLPSWFNDLLLGYGDPSVAHYSKLEEQFTMMNFDDTFLSVEHVKESFADDYEVIVNENDLKPPYRIALDETEKKVRIFQEEDESRGPYPFCKRRFNAVLFTKAQVEGIYSGMQHGLTVIVGPPGTGKTDVAAQIINNIYHGWPSERTLVVAHSNQALNYLFQKITERDVDERHLLRLGHGEEYLGMGKDFSREGRVNHILEKRLQLLAQVERLQKSIQQAGSGDVSSSCETALYFYEYQLLPRWFEFERKSKQCRRVGEIFPFAAFFDDLGEALFAEEKEEDGERQELNYENNMQIAHSCWNYIRSIFDQLNEFRAFESLRSRHDRVEYLLTSQAKVIAMTCTHAALRRKEFVDMYFHYDNLIVEEAAQILEIETFIPFLLQPTVQGKNRLRRVVLIGDHYQLPPVVKSQPLQRYSKMEQSMFTRLVRLGVRTIHLDKQGRARQELAALYSWRYNNLGNLPHVLADEEFLTANAGFAHAFQLVNVDDFNGTGESTPVAHFYQCNENAVSARMGKRFLPPTPLPPPSQLMDSNLAEAEFAVAIFMYMRIVGYPAEKITILTTYNGQKHLIRDVLRKRCASNFFFGKPAKVTTVDKYQGEQNDYIILSLVRTAAVGHIRDVRRLVVAFSRARLGLYVLARVSLFENCFELTPAFRMFQNRPRKLIIIPNEAWPTKRLLNEASLYSELTIDDMPQMVNFVYDLYVSNFDVIQAEHMKQHGKWLTPTESSLPVLLDNENKELMKPAEEEESQQPEDSAIVFEVLDE
ncbi:Intron-binding protein aquarius, partial [Trichinella pseudospiralis]